MYFDGSIRDIVQPVDTKGPWHLTHPELAGEPVIPCQSCHWVHREGSTSEKPTERISVAGRPVNDTVAFYDRREQMHFAAASLAIPALYDGPKKLKVSPDPRQAVCYQCHAPDATRQVRSGDDRTPMGIHEGLSCYACHENHSMRTRATCDSGTTAPSRV